MPRISKEKARKPEHLKMLFERITEMRKEQNANVDKYGAHCLSDTNETPDGRFRFLVGLLLSSQTQDPVTAQAIFRLDRFLPLKSPMTEQQLKQIREYKIDSIQEHKVHKLTIENVRDSDVEALAQLIKPVGFYNQKAKNLFAIANQINDVPNTMKDLMALPGIGLKMATIAMDICHNKVEGISVDTHMQRICQKLNLGGKQDMSASATEVQGDLEEWVPKDMWKGFNALIVGFGQVFCTAKKPPCERCTIAKWCIDGK